MIATSPHPRDGDALEYVLGTQPASERAAFAREVAADPVLAGLVSAWETRLAPLAERVPAVEPTPELWRRLSAAASNLPRGEVVAWPAAAELGRLRRSRALWRGATGAVTALAASLLLFIATERLRPVPPASGLVAVVNRSGELPALLVRVDPRGGVVQVRALAAETPADRALELWSIVGSNPPRSLGVIAGAGVTRASVPTAEGARLEGATLAVSVEPRGGSPTGGPTGPVIYTGRLVPETP